MPEAIVPQAAGSLPHDGSEKRCTSGESFTRVLLRDHAVWAVDLTSGASPPRGWQALVRALFNGIEIAVMEAPGGRASVQSIDGKGGRLRIEIGSDVVRPMSPGMLRRVNAMVAEAVRVASETCPRCGRDLGPGAAANGDLVAHARLSPSCRPSPIMQSILNGIDALGRPDKSV